MKLNFTYWHVFWGVIAVIVLASLFNVIRLNNPQRKDWLLNTTHQIALLNTTLTQELWRYQFGISRDFNAIADSIRTLRRLRTELQNGEHAVSHLDDSELTALFDSLDLTLNAREQQINDFFIANNTLKKAIDFTQRQIRELQHGSNTSLLLHQLTQELYYAAYLPLNAQNPTLSNVSQTISTSLSAFPVAQQFFVERILAQTNDIIEKNHKLFALLHSEIQHSPMVHTEAFTVGLHIYFERQQRINFYLQSLLFIIAIFSIAYATYLTIKLSRKENALKQALSDIENLQYAFDQHAIISFSDAAGNFTRVNEKFCTLSEYSETELIGKNHWMMHAGENSESIYLDMVDKTGNGQVWHGELQSKTSTGNPYWVYATIVPFMNSMQQIYQLISIRTDITHSKRLEKQITESKNFIQKLTDTMTQGVYAIDSQGLCSFWNKQAELLLGWTQQEVLMRKIQQLVVYLDEQGNNIILDEAFLSNQTKTIEASARGRDGTIFPVSLTTAPLHERNKIIGFVVVFQDISELKKQQLLLNQAMRAAETANHTKSAFLANMSHEIRTPMNGIIGMTDLALDTELTPEQRELLTIAKNSASALLTIINDILDFSKIEAGKMELEAVEFNLHQIMRETIKNLSIRAYQKGLEMILDSGPEVPNYLIGDPGRLSQIIINLIGNAIKFTEHGEIVVRIRLHSQKDQWVCLQFAVEDTGIGIPEDRQKDVFTSFSQVDASVFRKYGGTGLGLSIAKQLVELMHGKIGVTSQVNKGTRFYFTAHFRLPDHEVQKITPIRVLRTMRALIVDDNAKMRNLMGHCLTSWGMQVLAVKNATDALEVLRRENAQQREIHLLILDEELPDLDGFSLVEQLQQQQLCNAPVIMLLSTIYSSAGRTRNHSPDIACVISKPASQSDLLDAVHTVFNGPVAQPLAADNIDVKVLKPLNILLAEDNVINQQLAIRLLEKQQHKVTVANNGEECLIKLGSQNFDLILMDFQMPVMDGLEATRRIRQRGLNLPIIAMTANAMKGDRERALETGMTDYLTKPIKVQELFDVLARYFPQVEKTALPVSPVTRPPVSKKITEQPAINEPPVCDWKSAVALLGGDEEILCDMAQLYIANADKYVEEIAGNLQRQATEELARGLHTLKGIFASFKASGAEQLLISTERAAKEHKLATVLFALPKIKDYAQALKTFLIAKLASIKH